MIGDNSMVWPVSAPDGKSPCGTVKIDTFTVSEEDARFHNIRSRGRGSINAGTYKRLMINGDTVMSNTPMEIRTNRGAYFAAKGRVLINGLGLGMLVEKMLTKDEVEHITVIEKNPEVIALVGPVFEGNERVTIVEADAFEYQPPKGETYQLVWHDIWTFITSDNLPEMHKLHRKYGRRAEKQMSWAREECELSRDGYRVA